MTHRTSLKMTLRAGAIAVTLSAGPALLQPAAAQSTGQGQVAEAVVSVGKSQVIELPEPYESVMVADPKVADVLPMNSHAVYVVGKGIGSTALTIYGPGKKMIAAVNVVVSGDLEGLRKNLADLLPGERNIAVKPANQSIVLAGTAGSPAALQQALVLAESYAPGKVVNLLAVEGTQQVMLSVRFAEMQRTAAKDLNINLQRPAGPAGANPAFQINTGDTLNSQTNVLSGTFGSIAQRFNIAGGNLNLLFDALEQKGLVKTLAEPNLIANSGDKASFLAGGEFPIPVQQSAATGSAPTITIEYKQFGVALGFTPTILKDGMINLVVSPEVSSIDPTTSVNLGIIRVPGIKVRRANTTVELRDGESFTIAGLLQDDYTSQIQQFPWLGNLPVIGALLRSNGYQKNETELVIVITPHLVTARRGETATPVDNFTPPSDLERYLNGVQESASADKEPAGHVLH